MNIATVAQVSLPLHPLDPLMADEISQAVAIVRKTRAPDCLVGPDGGADWSSRQADRCGIDLEDAIETVFRIMRETGPARES